MDIVEYSELPAAQLRELQRRLADEGFDPGSIDGIYGAATRRAIEDYERRRGRDPTGEATPTLLAELRALVPAMTRKPKRSIAKQVQRARALPAPAAVLPAPPLTRGRIALEPDTLYAQVADSVWSTIAAPDLAAIESMTDVSQGSAVAVAPDRLLTNCHPFGERKVVVIVQGETVDVARLIAADVDSDLCVLEPEKLALRPVDGIRPYSGLRVGERVFTIGSPSALERSLGEGLISGLRVYNGIPLIQTTAPISPGSSGGGLFDRSGNLVGITTFLLKTGQQLNFAIAVESFWNERGDSAIISALLPPTGCGESETLRGADGSPTLLAYAPSGSPVEIAIPPDVRADLARQGGSLAIVELSAAICAIRTLIAEHADRRMVSDVSFSGVAADARALFREGDKLVIDVAAASEPRYVSVDYVVHTGEVWHLYPDSGDDGHLPTGEALRLGDGSNGPAWQIGAPFGKDLVLVTLSTSPFGAGQQPGEESAEAYRTRLQQRLRSPAGDPIHVFARVIETRPR